VALVLPVTVLGREALSLRSVPDAVSGSGEAIVNSLVLAASGATAVGALAVWIGCGRARAHPRLGRPADVLLVVLFALPSTVVGVGLIGLWNRPGPLGVVYVSMGRRVHAEATSHLDLSSIEPADLLRVPPRVFAVRSTVLRHVVSIPAAGSLGP
jgi:ABC-type Fe3+ transport system permease subunit